MQHAGNNSVTRLKDINGLINAINSYFFFFYSVAQWNIFEAQNFDFIAVAVWVWPVYESVQF